MTIPLWYGYPAPLVPVKREEWLISGGKELDYERVATELWRKEQESRDGEAE